MQVSEIFTSGITLRDRDDRGHDYGHGRDREWERRGHWRRRWSWYGYRQEWCWDS